MLVFSDSGMARPDHVGHLTYVEDMTIAQVLRWPQHYPSWAALEGGDRAAGPSASANT